MSYFENIRIHDGTDILEVETDGSINVRINDGAGTDIDSLTLTDRDDDLQGEQALITAANMFGRVSDTVVKNARLDASTEAQITITYGHHELHDGTAYSCSDVVNVSSTTQYWMVTTPDTTAWAHMIFDAECTGEMLLTITEGADRTGTTALSKINHNRNSANTSGLTMHRGYSAGTTNGAVTLRSTRVGSTGVGSKTISGGGLRGQNEYILKQNTKYIIAATTYANVYVSLHLEFYEHTDRN